MPNRKAMLQAAGGYVRRHPEELLRALRNVIGMRVGLPLDALRWLAGQANGKRAPKDVQIEAVPPGIRAGATIDLMGTTVRASSVVYIERISLSDRELPLEIRLADVSLKVIGDADTPVAALIKSGALDLSKPGNLAAYMPKRPPSLIEAKDDRIVIDLLKDPKIAKNGKLERLLALVTPIVTVRSVESEWEHLDVLVALFPNGVGEAVAAVRGWL